MSVHAPVCAHVYEVNFGNTLFCYCCFQLCILKKNVTKYSKGNHVIMLHILLLFGNHKTYIPQSFFWSGNSTGDLHSTHQISSAKSWKKKVSSVGQQPSIGKSFFSLLHVDSTCLHTLWGTGTHYDKSYFIFQIPFPFPLWLHPFFDCLSYIHVYILYAVYIFSIPCVELVCVQSLLPLFITFPPISSGSYTKSHAFTAVVTQKTACSVQQLW